MRDLAGFVFFLAAILIFVWLIERIGSGKPLCAEVSMDGKAHAVCLGVR